MLEYPMLKAAILNHVGVTPEGYRRKFREESFSAEEHHRAVVHRLQDYTRGLAEPGSHYHYQAGGGNRSRVVPAVLGSGTAFVGATAGTHHPGSGDPTGRAVPGSRTNA
ncbi:UNVERIFIED_CONTAM: hypothetical protein FKN15_056889 [Acipenser sinensis]